MTSKNVSLRAAPALLLGASVSIAANVDQLEVVNVTAAAYKTDVVVVGPFGSRSIIDTPYAVDIAPADLIRNQQLKSVREVFRYLPSVQGENIRPQTRGMQAGVVQNTRIDGLNMASTTDYPVEQFERIEVLNGLAGALFGPAQPGGTFNYVLKRPTRQPVRSIAIGYATQSSKLASVDFSDTVGSSGIFGYRLNALSDRGEGYVDRSRLERTLVSLAADVNFSDATQLEFNGSRYHYLANGFPGTVALANNVRFPAELDPKRVGYGQPYGGDDNVTETLSARLRHAFDETWRISGGVLLQDSDRASTVPTNTITSAAGTYRTTAATTTFSLDRVLSNTVTLNGSSVTGGVTHELFVANTGFEWTRYTPTQTGAITLGTATLDAPVIFPEPAFPDFKSRFKALTTRQQSITIGDTMGFAQRWSLGLVASQSWIDVRNRNRSGATTSTYDDDGASANVTLAYKPVDSMNAYASYADSLQQGDIAPAGSANAGIGLAPYRSKQYELGYKAALGSVNLTAAVFRIERPYAYVGADNVFGVRGEQVNHGVELAGQGAINDQLSIFGGITYLDPKLRDTGSPATNDQQILGLSKFVGSVVVDYRLPMLPALAFNVHVGHASKRAGDHANSYWVDGYTIADVGVRYSDVIFQQRATFNLSVNNVTDERYWANITPAGQNGYAGAGAGNGILGSPRMVRAALQIDF